MARVVTFGLGGYDPKKPNGNIISDETFPDPEPTPQEIARQNALKKLKALGLSEAEVSALLGA